MFWRLAAASALLLLAGCQRRDRPHVDGLSSSTPSTAAPPTVEAPTALNTAAPRPTSLTPSPRKPSATSERKAAERPQHPRGYRDAKRRLRGLYRDGQQVALYTGCTFDHWRVDWDSCCYQAKHSDRRRMEWEHAVPASLYGRQLESWREGHVLCGKKRGRNCARRADKRFRMMEGDMHNLFPVIGEINEARGNDRLGEISGEAREYGRCDFEVHRGYTEPRPGARGDLARAYLYMAEAYPGFNIVSDKERRQFVSWHRADPPGPLERRRNDFIEREQGNRNPWIDVSP